MKKTESYLWDKLKTNITKTHFTRHEDGVTRGIPDVSYGRKGRNGWIELKSYPLPSLCSIPSYDNFKRTQRRWLFKRGTTGGSCWLLTGFGDHILLTHWSEIDLCGKASLSVLISHSVFWGPISEIHKIAKFL